MAETLLFYGAVEKFDAMKEPAKKAALGREIFARFVDQNSESPDTVTLTAEHVRLIEERIASDTWDNAFQEAAMETLVLMSSNAMPDFLDSLHIPSLEECFTDQRHLRRLRKFAGARGLDSLVELVAGVVEYEKAPADDRSKLGTALYHSQVETKYPPADATPIALALEKNEWSKGDCVARV